MKATKQIALLASALVLVGVGMILYKHFALGFPLFAGEVRTVWKVEARIDFDALGGPVTTRLFLPDSVPGAETLHASEAGGGYSAELKSTDDDTFFEWHRDPVRAGPQSLYLRSELILSDASGAPEAAPDWQKPQLSKLESQVQKDVANAIAQYQLQGDELILALLKELNNPSSEILGVLLRDLPRRSDKLDLAIKLLAYEGIPARMLRGVQLQDRQRDRPALFMIEVWQNNAWELFDPREITRVPRNEFLVFQQGREPLFEVYGGKNSELRFSVLREKRAAFLTAVENARNQHNALVDFSIYSLPIAQQNTFKLLLLMPLGALVVVILRNLVGLRTSGTFMPILISLAFLQTGLLVGIILFLLVVGSGLLMRSYLTRLNLLLVPRIAAVLVFVIIIYGAFGIAGHKLGFEWILKVTLFPLIILSWTIERMSVLWDEEGAREVFVQGGGSLLTAALAYLLMSNQTVADAIFLYPEGLLILLAVIIAIGSYSGYRLSDLRRFEPMKRL